MNAKLSRGAVLAWILAGFAAAAEAAAVASGDPVKRAVSAIRTNALMDHARVLASDRFEGRGPGTPGEELTVEYLIGQFRAMGLKPGHPNGSWTQDVPLAGSTAEAVITYRVGDAETKLGFPGECVAASKHFVTSVEVVDSPIVFVGYGVVAPEYGWDDFKGVDVRGKTLLMLVNDPPLPDPRDPTRLDPGRFKGSAMTYYGRWTYKYEIAAQKGAAAVLIVHETGPAGYPWPVVVGSWGRENFDLQSANKNLDRCAIEAWIHLDKARELVAAGGEEFSRLKQAALSQNFRPVELSARATFRLKNTLRELPSRNVIAKLEGSDAKLKDEYVIYTAHWDHLGKNAKLEGDTIFNGARDNATGVAALLEIARAFGALKPAPKRSVLFLAVTAEEQGLLGAKFYAREPLYPLERTLANINMDSMNPWGRTRDITVIGHGNSTLEDILEVQARARGRVISPDAEPEKGRYYRSDHFEFAKLGVPGLYTSGGTHYIGRPAGYGLEKSDEYTTQFYHKVSDEIKPDWDLSGLAEDARLLFLTGLEVAQGRDFPVWKPGAEFKAIRERMLGEKAGSSGGSGAP